MPETDTPLTSIRARIDAACAGAGRAPQSVTLLAVSKTRGADEIAALADQGQRHFGENYLQEALDKMPALADRGPAWHFIGPIQSNKTRDIAAHFDWVHTVDRAKVARRLNEQRPDHLPPLNVCIQVNVDDEASKSGVALDQV
jgi:pyridoxal phosphate enzyme (YggS family)